MCPNNPCTNTKTFEYFPYIGIKYISLLFLANRLNGEESLIFLIYLTLNKEKK